MEGILRGEIRGLWVIATNPAHSWINQGTARDILSRLDFLVVQDMYHSTETAQLADLVLPAAGWGEKEGTFINSERRIGIVRKVARAPGEALADFHIFKLIAEYWGCGEMFRRWESPAAVFQLLKQLSAGQPCDITGIDDYENARRTRRRPMAISRPIAEITDQERRLFADGQFLSSRRPGAIPLRSAAPASRAAQSQDTRSCCSPAAARPPNGTRKRAPPSRPSCASSIAEELYVEINPQDAARLDIHSGDRVDVSSQRGQLTGRAVVTAGVQPGQVFVPMHYGSTNLLTNSSFDPYSHQPAYKSCAVTVELSRRK